LLVVGAVAGLHVHGGEDARPLLTSVVSGAQSVWSQVAPSPPLPLHAEVIVDVSPGSTATPAAVEQVVSVVLARITMAPGSDLRLSLLTDTLPRTVLQYVVPVPPGKSRQARETFARTEAEHALQQVRGTLGSLFSYKNQRSPLAMAIGSLALTSVTPGVPKVIIVITDGRESSPIAAFGCTTPGGATWVDRLQRNGIIAPLASWHVVFAYTSVVDMHGCAPVAAYEARAALWRTALQHTAGFVIRTHGITTGDLP
jgi:hypothetical protein